MQRRDVLVGAVSAVSAMALSGSVVAQTAPVSRDIIVDGLAATWLQPAGVDRFPAALIIAGSGPTDRDGNSANGLVKTDAYKLLATALAERGVATLRFDKRGVGASKSLVKSADDAKAITIATFVRDAERLIAWIALQPGVTSRSLIGHSEGGLIALLFDPAVRVDAIVQLTAPGRSMANILADQIKRIPLPPETQTEAERVIAALKAGTDFGAVEPPLDQMFAPAVQPFLRSVANLEPAALLAMRREPVLVIGGGKDIQLPKVDYDTLVAARPERTASLWLDSLTHVLKAARQDDPAQTAVYREPQHPLMPSLADRIAAWLKAPSP
jgi:uncharacterized protein